MLAAGLRAWAISLIAGIILTTLPLEKPTGSNPVQEAIMSDELIAALEHAMWWGRYSGQTGHGLPDDAKYLAIIRAHIADLKAGTLVRHESDITRLYISEADERAKVVAYARDFAGKVDCRGCPSMEPNVSINLLADAIASGAHMENNNAD
jgi:hypothetical protein